MKKIHLIFSLLLITFNAFAQHNDFRLSYQWYSMSPLDDMTKPHKVLSITGETMSYFVTRGDSMLDTGTYTVAIRPSSIDSILKLVKHCKDTIGDVNIHLIDGGVNYLYIKKPKGYVVFEMFNTFNTTALAIIKILNPYILPGHEFNIEELQKMIDDEKREDETFKKRMGK